MNHTVHPYRRMSDRKLLKLYVASCEKAHGDALLSADGFLQADELESRGYKVHDLQDLKKRLEK